MTKSPKPKAYIFDLGRVIIDFDFVHCMNLWAKLLERSYEDIERLFVIDAGYDAYERNHLSRKGYRSHCSKLVGQDISEEMFLQAWNAIFKGFVPEVLEILQALKGRVPLYLLSNTNEAHFEYVKQHYPEALAPFDMLFTSFELQARKPEPEIYEAVLAQLPYARGDCHFFDDKEENITGAEAVGLPATVFRDAAQLRQVLESHGWLESSGPSA